MILTKPPKGWNTWNTFGSEINEDVIKESADAMVSTGLKDAGYEYIVIDDCWSLPDRDENGRIITNPTRFPSGMKALADYVHSLGLKFGMYSCAGIRTCAGFPGSLNREFIDAQMFAEFGIDLLKYDFCFFPKGWPAFPYYNKMSMALKSTGRDILFSACNWGDQSVERWIRSTGAHMYRSTGDIGERYSAVRDICTSQFDKWQYAAPGCYNDMDMLICGMDGIGNVGHPGLCGDVEYKSHFAMWCMTNSPLMIGSDLRRLRPEIIDLLKNPGLLRINEDEECRPPIMCYTDSKFGCTMVKHLSNNEIAIGIFNLGDDARRCNFRAWEIGLTFDLGVSLTLTDVFTGEVIDDVNDILSVKLAAHDCKVYIGKYKINK